MNGQIFLLIGLWILFLGGFFLFVRGSALGRKKGDELWLDELPDASWPNERRRYKRRYIPIPVNYGSLEQAVLQEITLTHDVGKGGIRFPAKHPLRQGSRLYLSMTLPRSSPLSLFGEVVWQKPGTNNTPRFDTGVKFIGLSTANIMRIARHL